MDIFQPEIGMNQCLGRLANEGVNGRYITDNSRAKLPRFLSNRNNGLLQKLRPGGVRTGLRGAATRENQFSLALTEIKKHLLDFIATHTWEELRREWTLRAGARGLLDAAVAQVDRDLADWAG